MNRKRRHTDSITERLEGYAPRGQSGPIPTILVALDNPMTRHQISSILRREKFLVDEVEDHHQAADWLVYCLEGNSDTSLPDIIVASTNSPRMNGSRLLEELRSRNWQIPFILITDKTSHRSTPEVKRPGSVFVFDHPFGVNDFLTAVLYLLAKNGCFRRIAGLASRVEEPDPGQQTWASDTPPGLRQKRLSQDTQLASESVNTSSRPHTQRQPE